MRCVLSTGSPPPNSSFEGPLTMGRLRRFPRADMIDLTLSRIGWSFEENWPGIRVCLLPAQPRKNWFPKMASFEQVLRWSPHTDLFVDRSGGRPRRIPNEKNARKEVIFLIVGQVRVRYFVFSRHFVCPF